MKSLIVTILLVGSSVMGMTNRPDGVYQGQGRWRDNQGQSGDYDITSSVKAGLVSSTYTFNGQSKKYEFEAKTGLNDSFDVLVGGHKVGEGYCMSVQCHYSISYGGAKLEENLTFYENYFYRIGSKQVDGKVTTWEESMTKQEQ